MKDVSYASPAPYDDTMPSMIAPKEIISRLPDDSDDPRHIIDILLEERCTKMASSPFWPLYKRTIYPLLRYQNAVKMADDVVGKSAMDTLNHISQLLTLNVTTQNLERIPKKGRIILASTHPTGIADGIAMFDVLKNVRPDMKIFANRDAIRSAPQLAELIIPVEWLQEKRTRQRSRETLIETKAAFSREECIVLFPSGRLAYMQDRVLTEQDWMISVVSLARKYDCKVIPIHMAARNSWMYYWFRNLNDELRDITLFNELLNKKNKPFHLTIGNPIDPDELDGDPEEVTKALREHAVFDVPKDLPWKKIITDAAST